MDLAVQIEELFRSDRKKFLGFIRQRVRTAEEAEDILQDVFTNVLAAAQNATRPIDNMASWVFTSVRNRIIDFYRKKRADTFSEMQLPQSEDSGESYESFISDSYMTPENEIHRQHIWDSLMESLDELPEEQREVFVKNELEGIPFRQIAEETGVNINTLLARKRYAVLHLRRRLQPHYDNICD